MANTKIVIQQINTLDSSSVNASKFPRYTVRLGNSISSITAAELTEAVDAANNSAIAAKVSETNSKVSETNSKVSETNSKVSETNSKVSETNSKVSETNSKASELAAAVSEANARASQDNAKASETNSKASELASKTSEDNAKVSETNSKVSELASKTSEDNAKVSELAAKESEDNAKVSEDNAAQSAADAAVVVASQWPIVTDVVANANLAQANGIFTNVTAATTNTPIAQNAVLEVYKRDGATHITQRFIPIVAYNSTNAGRQWTRIYDGSTWSTWAEIFTQKSVPVDFNVESYRGDLSSVDINTLGPTAAGIWNQPATGSATTANNYPENSAGTLFVTPSVNGAQQRYESNNGNVYIRSLTAAWNGTNGPWGTWTGMPMLGYGKTELLTQDTFDYQQFDWKTGGRYLIPSTATVTNSPSGIPTGVSLTVVVESISSAGNRALLTVLPDVTDATYKTYKVIVVGAKGSRVFTIKSESNSSTVIPILLGGTGATTEAAARTNLSVYSKAEVDTSVELRVPKTTTINTKALSSNVTLNASDVGALALTGGTVDNLTITTPLAITSGGTGGATAVAARTNLSVYSQAEITTLVNSLVPKTTTINTKALSGNITLTATDVGSVPTSGGTVANLTITTPLAITSGGTGGNTLASAQSSLGINPTTLAVTADLNTATSNMKFVWNASSTNTPVASSIGYGETIAVSATRLIQLGYIEGTIRSFVRFNNAGTWSSWAQSAYNEYDLTTAWITITGDNGWVNHSGQGSQSKFRKLYGRIYVTMNLTNGTQGAQFFTLPVGYRPASNTFITAASSQNVVVPIYINPNGVCQMVTSQNISNVAATFSFDVA